MHAQNRAAFGRPLEEGERELGLVCTFTAMVLKSRTAYFFHVGDTRIHQVRKGKLTQLTRDHTTAVSASETFLVRAMGLDSNVDIDFGTTSVEPGDAFVLTTDGVHGVLQPEQLLETWTQSDTPQAACEALLQRALDAGSTDNLTAQGIVVEKRYGGHGLFPADGLSSDGYGKWLVACPGQPRHQSPVGSQENRLLGFGKSQIEAVIDGMGEFDCNPKGVMRDRFSRHEVADQAVKSGERLVGKWTQPGSEGTLFSETLTPVPAGHTVEPEPAPEPAGEEVSGELLTISSAPAPERAAPPA